MKRLICPGAGRVEWQEIEEPALGPNQVRAKCRFGCEKHGTMAGFYKGYSNARGSWDGEANLFRAGGMMWNYPIPLGNMQCGEVVELGANVTKLKLGQRVFASAPFQKSFVVHESHARVLKDAASWQSGMLLDPGEFAVGAVRDGHVRVGDRVAVFGLGAIGLVVVQALKAAGVSKLVAIDPVAHRREVALRTGADEAWDPVGHDVGLELRDACGGIGPDVIVDFSGSPHALQAALRGVAYEGTVVCGAFPAPHTVGIDFGAEAHMNRPKIVFSRACSDPNPDYPRWSWHRLQVLTEQMIDEGLLKGDELVDATIPFEDLLDAYPRIAAEPQSSIKLSVAY